MVLGVALQEVIIHQNTSFRHYDGRRIKQQTINLSKLKNGWLNSRPRFKQSDTYPFTLPPAHLPTINADFSLLFLRKCSWFFYSTSIAVIVWFQIKLMTECVTIDLSFSRLMSADCNHWYHFSYLHFIIGKRFWFLAKRNESHKNALKLLIKNKEKIMMTKNRWF